MTILTLPAVAHNAQSLSWLLKARLAKAPPALSGYTQRARLDGGSGLWMATFTDIVRRARDDFAAWGSLEAILDGGIEQIIVPRCEPRTIPWPTVNGALVTASTVPHDDDTPFDDDTEYSQPVIDAAAGASAAAGATTMTIDILASGRFRGGECFTIVHPTAGTRMYEIGRFTSSSGTVLSGTTGLLSGTLGVSFRPPLWEAVADETPIEFDNPRCTMVLANTDDFTSETNLRRRGTGGLTFIESPPSN